MIKFHDLIELLLEISGNMCIVIICCPVYDVIKFEVNPTFLMKPFFFKTKKVNKKLNVLKQCCTPQKACSFIFVTETPSRSLTLKKIRKSKSHQNQLSKLGQISCIIPHYIETKNSLYLGKFFSVFLKIGTKQGRF